MRCWMWANENIRARELSVLSAPGFKSGGREFNSPERRKGS